MLATVLAGCGASAEDAREQREADRKADRALARIKSDLKNVAVQMEIHYLDEGTYPASAVEFESGDATPDVWIVSADSSSFVLCGVDEVTSAWARYDSASGGLSTTGERCG